MDWNIADDKAQLGVAAAADGGELIRRALADRGQAYIVVATGASQFEMLAALVDQPDIDWSKVTAFHLDEYVALPIDHPASFRLYLWRRVVARLPLPLRAFHYIDARGDPDATCRRGAYPTVRPGQLPGPGGMRPRDCRHRRDGRRRARAGYLPAGRSRSGRGP